MLNSIFMSIKPGKYYAFDLDGNIAKIQTPIHVTQHGQDTIIDPMRYAEIQEKVRNRIDGWAPHQDKKLAFCEFGPDAKYNASFIASMLKATPGPAAPDYAEAVNGGHLFAIVTARGHSVKAFKEGFRQAILAGLWGVDPESMKASVEEFIHRSREQDPHVELPRNFSKDTLVRYYLNRCMWYPVTNKSVRKKLTPAGVKPGSLEIEDLKVIAIRRVMETVRKASQVILKAGERITLGFSDDTPANVRAIADRAFQDANLAEGVTVHIYDTSIPRDEAEKQKMATLRKRRVHTHSS